MITPLSYSRDQVEAVIKSARDFKLFHCTKAVNLPSIIQHRNIYSLGTLWGILPATRTNVRTGCPHPSAAIGFVDYVFLSKINRIAAGMTPIFGEICFQISPEILVDRESFAFPFNTGYDWTKPNTQSRKKSDASTIERCIQSQFTTDEFLVRRRISIEYVEKVYCPTTLLPSVRAQMTAGDWIIDIEPVPSIIAGNPNPSFFQRPDHGINLLDGGTIPKDRLFINPNNGNIVCADPITNCLTEFRADGDRLFDQFGGNHEVGNILRPGLNQAA